jgi:hypothetical protein
MFRRTGVLTMMPLSGILSAIIQTTSFDRPLNIRSIFTSAVFGGFFVNLKSSSNP